MRTVSLVGAPQRSNASWPFVEPTEETQETPWSFHFSSSVLKHAPLTEAPLAQDPHSYSCTYYENSVSESEAVRLPAFSFDPSALGSLREVEAQSRAKTTTGVAYKEFQMIGYVLSVQFQPHMGRKGTITLIDEIGISVTISLWAEEANLYLSENEDNPSRLRKGDIVHLNKVYRGSLKKDGKAQICYRTEKLDSHISPQDNHFEKFRWELSFSHLSVQTKMVHSLLVNLNRRGLVDCM